MENLFYLTLILELLTNKFMKKKALIFGITGQDGSYMLELLIKKKYVVHGLIRKSATGNTKNIDHLINDKKIFNKKFFLHRGDLLDIGSVSGIIQKVMPDEIYNFADQDHVGWSFEIPSYSFRITSLTVIEILEILKNQNKRIKFFQPISSNIFGLTKTNICEKNILIPNLDILISPVQIMKSIITSDREIF